MTSKDKPEGRPLALDPDAESDSSPESAFIARPAGAPVYYGFQVLDDVSVAGFRFGKITDFEIESAGYGDAFVIPPDDRRAGLVWEVSEAPLFTEAHPPEASRWGVWAVSFPLPMTSRENVRRNLQAILPGPKKKRLEWQKRYGSGRPL